MKRQVKAVQYTKNFGTILRFLLRLSFSHPMTKGDLRIIQYLKNLGLDRM